MTLIIVIMLIIGYLLIATGHLTGVSKAAIAMFLGTVGWVVYVCWGSDFVMQLHDQEYLKFLQSSGMEPNSQIVKYFINSAIFFRYVAHAAGVIMFLLATMSIVEILNNNGCFDFITEWVRTRNTTRMLWTLTGVTFVLSANLDNLTTTTVMLVIMHSVLKRRSQRMLVGSAIVLAANCGGCFTVIGDPIGIILWDKGAVSASLFTAHLFLPALAAWVIPTVLICRQLPHRMEIEWVAPPYRGDDTRLNRWQRYLMLLVGIGGLWFIPTFHDITRLPPFLGALCVLSVLWVFNEAFNRKLMQADQMAEHRIPRVLQYGAIQQLLFVMGIMLAMGVMKETGVMDNVATWVFDTLGRNVWVMGTLLGILSSVVDTFTISFFPVSEGYEGYFSFNGLYWTVIAYTTAVGGSLLLVGSVSGLALMRMEHIHIGWFMKTIAPKVLLGFIIGLLVLFAQTAFSSAA